MTKNDLDIADFLEIYKDTLSLMAARRMDSHNPRPYANLNVEQLTALFPRQLEQAARYARTGDLSKWLAFSQSELEDRVRRGYSLEEMKIASDSIFAAVELLVRQKFGGAENKAIREKYLRRIASIKSIQDIRITSGNLRG